MKNIVEENRRSQVENQVIRGKLKEYLHYFVLDFIYNSEFNHLYFYGGSSLRILYGLLRISEDLDFEVQENFDLQKFQKAMQDYFVKKLFFKAIEFKSNCTRNGILTLTLKFQVLADIGLSPNKKDKLKIKIDIRPVSADYLKAMKIVYTTISEYGRNFIVHHYDLSTLMATKIAAILQRKERGFFRGHPDLAVDFRGRDFFDLLWFMQKWIVPNENTLKMDGLRFSIEAVFDEIDAIISRIDPDQIKADIVYLFENKIFVENWIKVFGDTFTRLRDRYRAKKNLQLNQILIFLTREDIYFFEFKFLAEKGELVIFSFKITEEIILFAPSPSLSFSKNLLNKIHWESTSQPSYVVKEKDKPILKQYAALFLSKIEAFLSNHDQSIYFSKWESKLIRYQKDYFNFKNEIHIKSPKDLDNMDMEELEYSF